MTAEPQHLEPLWYTSGSGRIEFTLPKACVLECSHSGQCDGDVAFWLEQPEVVEALAPVTRELIIDELQGYGAWDDLETADIETLRGRVLWLAANDIREEYDL